MKKKTEVYAHRGYSEVYPENTMVAFEEAIKSGAHGIETDVQMTKDGKLVLIHDEKIDRTSNGEGFVFEYTYDQLKFFDFGIWKDQRFEGERIPLLKELLQLVKEEGISINLELKNNLIKYPELQKKVVDMVRKYDLMGKTVISSFNHSSLLLLIDDGVKCGALTYSELIAPQKYVKENRFYSYHPMYKTLNENTIRNLKAEGIPIYTYTVNDEEDMRMLIQGGVDVIITNDVVLCKKILDREK